jgi:curved DNA-binding protein CbpA
MSERGRDLYGLLGVAPDADAGEVARAYRRRLREVHPDTRARLTDGPDSAQADLRALQEAYAVLRDSARRAGYDDVQRRAALTQADVPPRGVAVPVRVRVRARRPPPARDWLIRVGPVR